MGAAINQALNNINRFLYYTCDIIFGKVINEIRKQNPDWDQWSDEAKKKKINLIQCKTDIDPSIQKQALTTTLFEKYWGFDFSTTASVFEQDRAVAFICQMMGDQSLDLMRNTGLFSYLLTLYYVCFGMCGNKLSPVK